MHKDSTFTRRSAVLHDLTGNFKYDASVTGCGAALTVYSTDGRKKLTEIPLAHPSRGITEEDCSLAETAINSILDMQRNHKQSGKKEHVAKKAVLTA